MRRLLAIAAGAFGLLVLPAAPASAAFTQAAWTSPDGVRSPGSGSDDWTVTVDQRRVPQQVTLAGVFDHPDGVAEVALNLEQGEYVPESGPPCAPAGFGQRLPGAPSGPTSFSFEVVIPCNGTYVIRANASSRPGIERPEERTALRLVLTMAAPAVPVTGLSGTASDGDDPQVSLAWEPVPETERDADFSGYQIERSVDGGGYELIASLPDADAAAFIDQETAPEGGPHRYRVVSTRRASSSGGTVGGSEAAPEIELDVPSDPDAAVDDGAEDGTDGDGTEGDGTEGDGADDDAGGGSAAGAGRRGSAATRRSTGATRPAAPPPRTYTTVDTGFGETLPFDGEAGGDAGGEQALPQGDPAVVAEFDDGGGEDTRKQTLALIAGGGAMGVGALGLRRILRKAAAPTPYDLLQ